MKIRRIINNEHAVSPIVATLILIVVAIAGAAAVGTILGSYSSDVSDGVSSEAASSGASARILTGGSTSVAPLAESLKSGFESTHPGTSIEVQKGGDSAGIAAVGMDVLDIALLSRELTQAEKEKYTDLQTHWVGSSAVVMIGGENVTAVYSDNKSTLTPHNIEHMYKDAASGGIVSPHANLTHPDTSETLGNITVYRRAETRSGPEYVFSKFIAHGDGDFIADTRAVAVTGDQGMLDAIANNPDSIGFVDFTFALEAEKAGMDINFIAITDGTCSMSKHCVKDTKHMQKHVKGALNGDNTQYPVGLLNNMYMVTNGWPSSVEARFINFAQQPSSMDLYSDAGYFSLLEINEVVQDPHGGHSH